MPDAIKTICTYPGCNTLVLKGRCSKHEWKEERPQAQKRGYDHRWRRLRNWFIRANPVCQIQHYCDGDPATEVDHVKPIYAGGAVLDQRNLQATCHRCHSWKTRQDIQAYGHIADRGGRA